MRLVSIVILIVTFAATAADITWSGDVQYRFRYEWDKLTAITDSVKSDLTHRYSWSLKGAIKAKENLEFGLKISNPSGNSTDPIIQNDSFPGAKNNSPVALREFYFHWSVGIVSLWAVRIPVPAATILELTAYESKQYAEVGTDPWATLTDNAQNGLFLDIVALKTDRITLRPSLLTAVALDPGVSLSEPTARRKLDQWKTILSLQAGFLKDIIVATPAAYFRTNIAQSVSGDKSNHAAAGGIDIKAKVGKKAAFNAGFAAGSYNNDAQTADTSMRQVEPSGLLAKIGVSLQPGFGVVNANVTFGQWKEALLAPDKANRLIFGSLKYGIPVKNLTIEPWIRTWYYFNNQTDATKLRIRGELSVIGVF